MSRLTESAIEDFAIKLFERLGYDYIHAPDIATATPIPTTEKCSVIQVAPAQKPFPSSPEKCYSFSGFLVSMQA
jgi:hypothetical protein